MCHKLPPVINDVGVLVPVHHNFHLSVIKHGFGGIMFMRGLSFNILYQLNTYPQFHKEENMSSAWTLCPVVTALMLELMDNAFHDGTSLEPEGSTCLGSSQSVEHF